MISAFPVNTHPLFALPMYVSKLVRTCKCKLQNLISTKETESKKKLQKPAILTNLIVRTDILLA